MTFISVIKIILIFYLISHSLHLFSEDKSCMLNARSDCAKDYRILNNISSPDNSCYNKSKKKIPVSLDCKLYKEPDWQSQYYKKLTLNEATYMHSDHLSFKDSRVNLDGDVVFFQNNLLLQGKHLSLDKIKRTGLFYGDVSIRNKGKLIEANSVLYDEKKKQIIVEDASFILYAKNARGTVKHFRKDENNNIYTNNIMYTHCPQNNNSWHLKGDYLNIDDKTSVATVKNVILYFYQIPIFYLPYLSFSIDFHRKTGFLYPTIIKYSESNGISINFPFYWNLAPNYDLTIFPLYTTKRGWLVNTEFRYLNSHINSKFNLSYLHRDNKKINNPFYQKNRWFFILNHKDEFIKNGYISIDYGDASDESYLQNFDDLFPDQTYLNQNFSLFFQKKKDNKNLWDLVFNLSKKKNMKNNKDISYGQLPNIRFDKKIQLIDNLNISILSDFTRFDRVENWEYLQSYKNQNNTGALYMKDIYQPGYGISNAIGKRIYFELSLDYLKNIQQFFIKSSFRIRANNYDNSRMNKEDVIHDIISSYNNTNLAKEFTYSPCAVVPYFSLELGQHFIKENVYSKYKSYLTPKLKYIYAPYYKNQEFIPVYDTEDLSINYENLWVDQYYKGFDRLPNMNQISYGFDYRLLNDNQEKKISMGMGQILYLSSKKIYISKELGSKGPNFMPDYDLDEELREQHKFLNRKKSPIVLFLDYNLTSGLNFHHNIAWDPLDNSFDNYSFKYNIKSNSKDFLNFGVNYHKNPMRFKKNVDHSYFLDYENKKKVLVNGDMKTFDLDFAWSVNKIKGLQVFGHFQTDLTNNYSVKKVVGIGFMNCCYRFSFFLKEQQVFGKNASLDNPIFERGLFFTFSLTGLTGVDNYENHPHFNMFRDN